MDNYWDGYTTVAISPSGKIVAAANRFIVVLFDIEERRQVGWFWAVDQKGKNFRLPRTGLGDTLDFIDEDHIVTTGMGGIATVWDIRNGQKQLQIDPPSKGMYAISLAFSPTTSQLALGTWDGSIVTYKLDENRASAPGFLLTHVGRVNDVVFSADGKYMASAGDDKTVTIWDMETRKHIGRRDIASEVSDLEVVSSRRSLVIAGDDVAIWKFLTEEEVKELKEDKAVAEWVGTGALYALQAGLLFTGLGGGISTHDPANCGRFTTVSPDGKFLVDVKPGPMSNKVTVLDVDQNEIMREVDVPNAICDLEFTEDGKHLVLAGDGGMFLVDTNTWVSVPMHLIVDSFSRAPMVLLSDQGHMGLDVTRHRPDFAIPEFNKATGDAADTPSSGPDNAELSETPPETSDQIRE
ncbi:MAG: WD40 repeat domain-containing protein [Xanthomonadales bacterium]|nr:WD40 repeat domain-containing protein [Xanthomonadales bacterium]